LIIRRFENRFHRGANISFKAPDRKYFTYKNTHTHAYRHEYRHAYIHTYIHIYIHMLIVIERHHWYHHHIICRSSSLNKNRISKVQISQTYKHLRIHATCTISYHVQVDLQYYTKSHTFVLYVEKKGKKHFATSPSHTKRGTPTLVATTTTTT